jgi:hypothetical protein
MVARIVSTQTMRNRFLLQYKHGGIYEAPAHLRRKKEKEDSSLSLLHNHRATLHCKSPSTLTSKMASSVKGCQYLIPANKEAKLESQQGMPLQRFGGRVQKRASGSKGPT